MRKNNFERLAERKQREMAPQKLDIDGLLKLLVDPKRIHDSDRSLMPTQREFIYDNRPVVGYMGAAGAAKTSSLCAAGLIRQLLVPDGRLLVARFDYNDLIDTTAKRMQEMMNALPVGTLIDRNKNPPMKWWIRPVGSDAEPSEITFMGLKENLGSYEFSDAIIDEADEVPRSAFDLVKSRLRHIRKGVDLDSQIRTLRFVFNPPDTTHWLYEVCTGLNHEGRRLHSPLVDHLYTPQYRENARNLPPGYYDEMLRTMPTDLADRLVRGQWGATFPGTPVYREFNSDLHVKRGLQYDRTQPILRFWDFGYRRPCVLWAQLDWAGRLLFLREYLGENMEASAFARKVKTLSAKYYPHADYYADFGDPAVVQKKDTGQTLAHFAKEGITMQYRVSSIESGVQAIRQRLELLIEGQPALQVDEQNCPILIRAFRGGYHNDDKGKPFKDGFYDHEMDAARYGVINVLGANFRPVHVNNSAMNGSVGSVEYVDSTAPSVEYADTSYDTH